MTERIINNYQKQQQAHLQFVMEAGFHKSEISRLREMLGKNCTYLSHEKAPKYTEDKDGNSIKSYKYFIKAVMTNNMGGKDTVRFEISGTPKELNRSDYNELYDALNNEIYAQS